MSVDTTWTDPSTGGSVDLNTGQVLTETVWDKVLSNLKHLGGTDGNTKTGNYGLGIAPSAWYADKAALQIGLGGALSARTNIIRAELTDNSYEQAADTFKALQTAAGTRVRLSGGTFQVGFAGSVSAGSTQTFTDVLTVTSSGPTLNAGTVFTDAGLPGFKIGGTATRSGTAGTSCVHIFDGTTPVGTLTNGVTLYSVSGELRSLDAAGNSTLLSPHDDDGRWVYDSTSPVTGKHLRVDMERLVKAVDALLGGGYVHEHDAPAAPAALSLPTE